MTEKQFRVMKRPDRLKITNELDPYLESEGYYRKQIAQDASCLFRIVAEKVYRRQDKHASVRSETCDYLRDNEKDFKKLVDGDYTEYVTNMRDMTTYGTEVEIAAMSRLYKKDFVIYEEVNQPPRKVTDNNFEDKILMTVVEGRQYCIVYPKQHIEAAAEVQAMVYESLYKDVFHDETVMEEKDKMLQATEENNSSQNDYTIPFKVAKALDPTQYRNTDYDSWVAQAKDAAKNGVRYKNGLAVGLLVKVQLDQNHPELAQEGYIQKIPYDGAPVNVFIKSLGILKSVPYNSVIPITESSETTPTSHSGHPLPGSPAPVRPPAFQPPQFGGPFPPQHYSGVPFHHPQQYNRSNSYPAQNCVRPPPVYPNNPNSGDRRRSNYSYRHNDGGGRSYGMNPLPPRYQQTGPRHYNNDGPTRTYPNRTLNNNTRSVNRYVSETKKESDSKPRRTKEAEDATPLANGDKIEKSKGTEDIQSEKKQDSEITGPKGGSYDRRRRRTDDDRSRFSNRGNNMALLPNGSGVSTPLLQGAPCPLPLIQGAPCRPQFIQEPSVPFVQQGATYLPPTTTQTATVPLTISLTSGQQPAAQDTSVPQAQLHYGVSMYPFQIPQYPTAQPTLVNVDSSMAFQSPVSSYAPAGGVYPPNVFPGPYPVPYQAPMVMSGGATAANPDMSVQVAPPESFLTELRGSPTSSGYNSAPLSPEDRARSYNMGGIRFPTIPVQGAMPPASFEHQRIADVQEHFQNLTIMGDGHVQFYTGQPMFNQPHPVMVPQQSYLPLEFGPAPNNN